MSLRFGALALAAIALHATLAARIAWTERSARDGEARPRERAWILGPRAATLEAAAAARIERALAHLEADGTTDPGWYDAYRAELTTARDLLARSLRACPGQARALARLAAVRWELDGPAAGGSGEDSTRMIALAARVAPDSAPVQILLGELLLRMARSDDGADRLGRAVELDPTLAARAVRALRDHAFTPPAILAILRPSPAVLLAVQPAFFAAGDPTAYLEALESALPAGGAAVLSAYTDSCLKIGVPERLLATVAALAPLPTARDEAERLHSRSRARLALQEPALALEDSLRARTLAPEDPRLIEQVGRAALATEDTAQAIAAFREALAVAARQGGAAPLRARLYRQIGVAEERQGRPDRAYDAYLKTLELEPFDVHAARRIREMRRAAGFETP